MRGDQKIIRPSQAWMAWRNTVRRWWLELPAVERRNRVPASVEVNCAALFYRDARRGDAAGYYQGLADVLQELEIVPNDGQIVQWDGSRLYVDRADPRVELTITRLAG